MSLAPLYALGTQFIDRHIGTRWRVIRHHHHDFVTLWCMNDPERQVRINLDALRDDYIVMPGSGNQMLLDLSSASCASGDFREAEGDTSTRRAPR